VEEEEEGKGNKGGQGNCTHIAGSGEGHELNWGRKNEIRVSKCWIPK